MGLAVGRECPETMADKWGLWRGGNDMRKKRACGSDRRRETLHWLKMDITL